ncbi:MAG: hypothetical protein IT360_08565 [Gemmatimonadaceae bacterium]|nr:hypothetical protein [Gemmatimonadaceae bacterium]
MRPLEYVLIAALLLAAVSYFVAPRRRSSLLVYAPHIALLVALVHGLIEGGRWSLYAAYLAAAVMAVFAVARRRYESARDRPLARRVGGVLVVLVAVASAGAALAFPIFSLPEPSGAYKIGTRWLTLVDSSRTEDLTPDPSDLRHVVVRLWFPADSEVGDPSQYSAPAVSRVTAGALGLPGFVLSHLPLVKTHSYQRARLANASGKWPLLLFSHGYGVGTESQNTVQMEELASHGYVVASIDHVHEAGAVPLPGDVVAAFQAPPSFTDTAAMARGLAMLERIASAPDTGALLVAVRDMQRMVPSLDTSIVRWTDDTRFVLDRLTAMSAPSAGGDTLMVDRLATDRVGVFGMSFGGATAATFCVLDARCVAGLNLDGLTYGAATDSVMVRPFFFATSGGNARMHEVFYERAVGPAFAMNVKGSTHMDYTDLGLISPMLRRLGVLGPVGAGRMQEVMHAVVVGFFGRYVRGGEEVDLVGIGGRFVEVVVRGRGVGR